MPPVVAQLPPGSFDSLAEYPPWLVVACVAVVAVVAFWLLIKLLKWALWLALIAVVIVGGVIVAGMFMR